MQRLAGIILTIFIASSPTFAAEKEKPVSMSYTNLIKCFPELKNEQWSTKVDLSQLKEQADKKFITSKSLLRYRQALLKDPKGQQKRLRLAAKPAKAHQFSYELTVDKLDVKGVGTPLEIPQSQRINPKQKDLDSYFLDQEVIEDEYSYYDTKLNNVSMSYKRNFKDVFEIELADPRGHRRILCEDKRATGIVCTCFQK